MRSRILQSGHTVSFDGARALTNYDDVFVIDTAYIPGAQNPIAAAVAVRLRVREKGKQLVVTADDHCVIYLLQNYIGNPELAAVYALACDSKFTSRARARAIVNDSDRGLHDAINARTLSVYNGCTLPAPFTLMYAGDRGYEMLNRVLKFCDRQSRTVLNAYFSGELPNPERFNVGPPGSGDLRINRLIHNDLQILNNVSPIGVSAGRYDDGSDGTGLRRQELQAGRGSCARRAAPHSQFRRRHRTADQPGSKLRRW